MFNVYSVVIILCIVKCCVFEWNTLTYLKREHSLSRPYQGAARGIPFWSIMGNTIVTNKFIRLTFDSQSQNGAVWNDIPVESKSWEAHIDFKVHGKGTDLFGDGFAFWYVKEKGALGTALGSKNPFYGLGIFIDTYSNINGPHTHSHPFISAMINNGTLVYDHDQDGANTQLAGCEVKFRNVDYETYIAIRYERDILTVSTDLDNKKSWKECLRVSGVRLPTNYYIGLSASTGDLSDNHDLISVKFYELEASDPAEDRSNIIPSASFYESLHEKVEAPKSGFSGIIKVLLILFGIIASIILAIIAFVMYQNYIEANRKRFY